MKNLLGIVLFLIVSMANAQHLYNTKKGVIAKGYDVTEYFNNKAVKGDKKHNSSYDGVTFYFANKNNKIKFDENPTKFIPQYGGYCAYALGLKSDLVGINPKTFEIRDGKLYLFYNAVGVNTLNKWLEENPEKLKEKADINWKNLSE